MVGAGWGVVEYSVLSSMVPTTTLKHFTKDCKLAGRVLEGGGSGSRQGSGLSVVEGRRKQERGMNLGYASWLVDVGGSS